jgi:hypothetical protein
VAHLTGLRLRAILLPGSVSRSLYAPDARLARPGCTVAAGCSPSAPGTTGRSRNPPDPEGCFAKARFQIGVNQGGNRPEEDK